MSAKPYTAEELAELRMGASEGLAGLTVSRALATLAAVEQEREQARRERDELREAARALLDILTAREGGRQCNDCYALATVADPLPGGKMAPAFERDPQAAVEKALARAASIRMPGVTPDGAPYPHPQDPSGGRERVEP